MLGSQQHITFKQDTHQYFDPQGNEFKSVSRVLRTVTPEFDRKGISMAIARVQASTMGQSVAECQQQILDEWDQIRDSSIQRGNWIHENIESYLTIGSCDKKIIPVGKRIALFLKPFYRYFCESVIYDSTYSVAGTADLSVQRQRDRQGVYDFYDFKTNESRGIYYDSIKREDNGSIKKHYNQFLKDPLSHLEHCNYNLYALQLSMYAYMAERTFSIRVGRLGIIFIDGDLGVKMLPVPYMKCEVRQLLEHIEYQK